MFEGAAISRCDISLKIKVLFNQSNICIHDSNRNILSQGLTDQDVNPSEGFIDQQTTKKIPSLSGLY